MRRAQAREIVTRCAALMLLLAGACRAQQSCPWLNAATAAGVLGGHVKFQPSGDSCTFTRNASQLRIEVQTVALPHKLDCGPNPTPLKAIGNEALACSLPANNGRLAEEVSGRVRDRIFFVRLTSNDLSRDALREKTRLAAEQVAGILF